MFIPNIYIPLHPKSLGEAKNGALAHLARAFDWQSRGGEFESRMLHETRKDATVASFSCIHTKNSISAMPYQEKSLPLSLITEKVIPNTKLKNINHINF